jgi:hypothetical protein
MTSVDDTPASRSALGRGARGRKRRVALPHLQNLFEIDRQL